MGKSRKEDRDALRCEGFRDEGCPRSGLEAGEGGRLFNQWVNEHDVGNPTGAAPIFVMDVFEHAFMVDYGLKRADYIAAFFRNVNWKAAEARL